MALRETLEHELNRAQTEENTSLVRERQMRVDELLARMLFEEEVSQIEISRFRNGGMPVWQDSTPLVCIHFAPSRKEGHAILEPFFPKAKKAMTVCNPLIMLFCTPALRNAWTGVKCWWSVGSWW